MNFMKIYFLILSIPFLSYGASAMDPDAVPFSCPAPGDITWTKVGKEDNEHWEGKVEGWTVLDTLRISSVPSDGPILGIFHEKESEVKSLRNPQRWALGCWYSIKNSKSKLKTNVAIMKEFKPGEYKKCSVNETNKAEFDCERGK